MTARTEAAVLWEPGGPWTVQEVEPGAPVAGEVLVELTASGICHTDDHLVTGALPQPLPAVGGHEAAGRPRTPVPLVPAALIGCGVALALGATHAVARRRG